MKLYTDKSQTAKMIGDGDMWSIEHEVYRNEHIDALYNMIVKLKENGVI